MVLHETKVKIDVKKLEEVITSLKTRYDEIGNRDSHEGRSRFSAWNNINKFYERESSKAEGGEIVLDVVGKVEGATARVYYKPSVTSLATPFRNCIVPMVDNHKFIFFDIKSAEFFMNCVFCGEVEAVNAYQRGEDIYMYYANLFPEGTERKVIKEILIANMYGVTPYRIAQKLGCTEAYADRLLRMISTKLPKMEMQKAKVIAYARRHNAYFAPSGFDQTKLVKVADVNEKDGFKPLLALSAYVQSALGMFMQDLIKNLQPRINGTILSVFDSLVVEIKEENKDRYINWIKTRIAPFRVGDFGVGDNFLQAKMNAE